MAPNHLVHLLAIAAGAHRVHDQLFGGHERQLVIDTTANTLGMHFKSLGDVRHQNQDCIAGEKRFRNDKAPVGGVIQRALEILHRVRLIRVWFERENKPRQ